MDEYWLTEIDCATIVFVFTLRNQLVIIFWYEAM